MQENNMMTGLTSRQVEEARARGEVNIRPDSSQKTVKDIIKENTLTYFNFIFVVLAFLLLIAGAYRGLTIIGAPIFNSLIGIVQQLRAKKILDNLSILTSVKIDTIRDGKVKKTPTEELVLGDVVIFKSGSQICADATVISGEISVNESLLTGESDEIPKKPGDKLLSGSFVVTGECAAKLTHVGEDSYVARLEAEAKEMSGNEESEMVRSINRFVLISGIAIIPIGILLVIQGHMNGYSFSENVTSMVAAVVGMIPEGLYVLVSVTLAVSAANLALKKVMLHDMKSIETLARVDVLCVDKTGTITEPTMAVEETIYRSDEETPRIKGLVVRYLNAQKDDNATMLALRQYFTPQAGDAGQVSTQGQAGEQDSVSMQGQGAGQSQAFAQDQPSIQDLPMVQGQAFDQEQGSTQMPPQGSSSKQSKGVPWKQFSKQKQGSSWDQFSRQGNTQSQDTGALRILPFSSKYKYSAVAFPEGTYVLGAPDIVLAGSYNEWKEAIETFSSKGMRVLVFAEAKGDLFEGGLSTCSVDPLLFITLKNPIREGAKDTFNYFADQGVIVKVISGDHPATVARIAGQAGIINADKAVDVSLLDPDEIDDIVEDYTVFARVSPDRKQDLVKALQKAGHTVAMTGDGVNDIMAMKTADCSVAMASGSEAAVQASQVVLLDSDFSHMPQIVAEGRKIIGNIERSATLFLSKNIFSMMLAIFSIIAVMSYPLKPEQISLITWFTISIPAFFLAVEPNERRITGHFMKRVLLKALPASITDFVLIAGLMIFGIAFGVSEGDISVAATFLLAVVGFMILYYISRPMSKYRIAVLIVSIIAFILSAYYLHWWFGVRTVSKKCMMLFVIFVAATEPCMRYLTKFFGFVEKKFLK